MQQLPNGCRRSDYSVWPKNWKTVRASLQKDWYITYRFYDPVHKVEFPKGKQIMVKGMNSHKDLVSRQQAVEIIMSVQDKLLINQGYNPITGRYVSPVGTMNISGETPFLLALNSAMENLTLSRSMMRDLRSTIKATSRAASAKSISILPVVAIRRSHIYSILSYIEQTAGHKSPHRFNTHRTDLRILFEKLIEMDAIEHNPVDRIKKMKVIKKMKEVLTEAERGKVTEHLEKNHFRFWCFCNIFFHSGSRLTEIMQLKREDVDLQRQIFKTTVFKRKQPVEVERVIKTVAMEYWQEVLKDAKPGQYIFAKGLEPGDQAINTDQISRRWKNYVKRDLGIEKDFYSLKHLNTTEVSERLGEQAAADMNQHTSTAMVVNIYDVGNKKRKNEQLKQLDNKL